MAVEGNGSYIRDNAISGMVGTNSTCTGQPTGIYCVVSIEDGPVTGSTTDLVFDNNYFDCSAKAACVNLNIVSGAEAESARTSYSTIWTWAMDRRQPAAFVALAA